MKFRDISMRGTRTTGGVEFNFGSIRHTQATAQKIQLPIEQRHLETNP